MNSCRFLLHLLPKGFVRIRNFGFLANPRRATLLPLCFQLFGAQQSQAEQEVSSTNDSRDHLPRVWWTDGGHPEVHRCGHPTSVSTAGHCCRMKRLSPARILRAFRRARSLCALPQSQSLLPAFSALSTRYAFALVSSRCPLPCSAAQSRRRPT